MSTEKKPKVKCKCSWNVNQECIKPEGKLDKLITCRRFDCRDKTSFITSLKILANTDMLTRNQ